MSVPVTDSGVTDVAESGDLGLTNSSMLVVLVGMEKHCHQRLAW